MLEAQLIRDGKRICLDCRQKVREDSTDCKNPSHFDFKQILDLRIKIGLEDLKKRGYD